MTTVCCPVCHEYVSIPAGIGSQVQVRCPLCQEQYPLVEALKGLPPLLIVVPDSESSARQVSTLSAVEPWTQIPQDESTARVEFDAQYDHDEETLEDSSPPAEPWRDEESPEVSTAQTEPPGESPRETTIFEGWGQAEAAEESRRRISRSETRSQTKPVRRPRRKQTGPIRSFVQIVGGGLLGLVIAQLILWWLPGNWAQGRRDPLGIANKVAAYAPFLVPAKVFDANMSGTRKVAASKQPTDPSANENSSTKEARYGMAGVEQANKTDEPTTKSEETGGESSDKSRDESNENVVTKPAPNGLAPNPADAKESSESPDESPEDKSPPGDAIKSSKQPVKGPESTAAPAAVDKAPENEPRTTRRIDFAQLSSVLDSALEAEDVWNKGASVPKEERRKQFVHFYGHYSKLGELLAVADRNDPSFAEQLAKVQPVLDELAKQTEKLTYIGTYSPRWINHERQHNGVMLYGTVVDYQPDPPLPLMRLKLPPPTEMEVTVVSLERTEPIPLNSKILVFGSLVDEPQKQIKGFPRDDSFAAEEGYSVLIPSTE